MPTVGNLNVLSSTPISLSMVNGMTMSTSRCVPDSVYAFVFGGCEMIDFTIKTLPCHFIPVSYIKGSTWACFFSVVRSFQIPTSPSVCRPGFTQMFKETYQFTNGVYIIR